MAAKIGTSNVLFRVGSGSPSKVLLGTAAVQTVPGAPVITDAFPGPGNAFVEIFADAPTDTGGLPITGYKVYADGVWDSGAQLQFNASGMNANSGLSVGAGTITVSALNAIGEGPQSENAP
jgi:hypothetical protein